MHAYHWCELTIRTDVELPELPQAADDSSAPVWHLTLDAAPAAMRPDRHWFHHWEFPDGRQWVAFARDAAGYLLRFPGLADFDIVPSARAIGCHPAASTPAHTLRHLILDQVLPLVAGGPDRLALHGSVVAADTGAVVFLGGPGHGKSTLAAMLARKGCELVSDDCCLLIRTAGGFEVAPSYPGVRLAPDSIAHLPGDAAVPRERVAHYTTKLRVSGESAKIPFRAGRLPLSRMYVIESRDEPDASSAVIVGRRTRREALFDLLNYTFHLDVGDARRIREAFDLAADVASRHVVKSLAFPWDLSRAQAVAEAILGDR